MPAEQPGPAAAPTPVRAGPVQAILDGIDLRCLRIGAEPLIDGVYVAVRAHDWSTVPAVVRDVVVRTKERSFDVRFIAWHRAGDLDFEWLGHIEGTTDGRIRYSLAGEARTDFEYCRIGVCVLHPDRLAGAAFRARTGDGDIAGELPRLIAPQVLRDGAVVPPIPAFHRLEVTSDTGEIALIESADAPFEIEDQRNWTDASFKSYIPPIRPGYPYPARQGQRFGQCVTIRVDGPPRARVSARDEPTRLEFPVARGLTLPAIGLGLPDPPGRPDRVVLTRVAALRPDHLRLSAWVGRPGVADAVDQAIEQAATVGCALEVALFIDANDVGAVRDVVSRLAAATVPVARWLAYDAPDTYRRSTRAATAALVREVLDESCPGAVLAAGTASDFVWLNRGRTTYKGVDALAWAIQPSRHASDDRSIMDNATAQGITVETARAFAEGRASCIGPVELSRPPRPGDPRQRTTLAAAWAVASLTDLCAAAPDSITYFETVGPRGLLATTGEPYPVYSVFEQLARMRGGSLRPAVSTSRRVAIGFAVDHFDRTIAIAANLTTEQQRVVFEGLASRPREMSLGPYEVVLAG